MLNCLLGLLTATLVLSACGSPAVAPISERPTKIRPQAMNRDEYQVRPGDTLYSIAFATSHDYRELAAWNEIGAPYLIYPGQRIVLKQAAPDPNAVATTQPLVPSSVTSAAPENRGGVSDQQVSQQTDQPAEDVGDGTFVSVPSEISPPQPSSTAQTAQQSSTTVATASSTGAAGATGTTTIAAPAFNGRWQWPVTGPVIQKFSTATGNKGIDIGGNAGTPVKAAASGKVVYAGSGLRGYGQLVIVQHSDEFLSAYAHNQSLAVNEGDTIRPGQTLGHMGSSGADKVKLHFEIRRNGDPVDPLKLLPRSST